MAVMLLGGFSALIAILCLHRWAPGTSFYDRMETLSRLTEEQAAEFRRDMNRPKKAKRKPDSD